MTEWKEYNGSDEQIAEIINCKTDVLCKYVNGTERFKSEMFIGDWKHKSITHYLICNPHPLADMICQQARTGQPVWVRYEWRDKTGPGVETYVTTTPDWNIPNAEYSFTEFKE